MKKYILPAIVFHLILTGLTYLVMLPTYFSGNMSPLEVKFFLIAFPVGYALFSYPPMIFMYISNRKKN